MSFSGTVAVTGLNAAVKGLRDIGLQRVVSETNREISKEVQSSAHSKLARQPIPKTRGAIGRRASQRSATIVLRYSRYPWIAGGEFGALTKRQFRPWLGNQYTGNKTPGYMVGATLGEQLPRIERSYAARVEKAFKVAVS